MQTRTYDIGDLLPGGYRVLDIRQGGMGVVYICHQRDTDELYAIKTVRMDGAEAEVERRLELFAKEVRTWVHISNNTTSPHLVKALTFNADHRMLCLEFVNGLALHQVVERGHVVHPVHALQWAKDIASGMEELHSRYGVVHRDLKPQNVLIQADSDRLLAKITDFGITRALTDDSGSFTRIGTPAYMAPEVECGAHADFRADIYAYGATLSWMLCGKPILDPEKAARLPGPLLELIERCLRVDPEERIRTFGEIRELLAGIELEPFAPGPGDQFCRLHRYGSTIGSQALAKSRHSVCPFCIQNTRLLQLESNITRSAEPATERKPAGDEPATAPTLRATAVTEAVEDARAKPVPSRRKPWRTAALLLALGASPLLLPDTRQWLASLRSTTALAGGLTEPGRPAAAQVEGVCLASDCEGRPLARPAGSTAEGPARYCADHATHECPLCSQTFRASEIGFEGKCPCGGAITTRN